MLLRAILVLLFASLTFAANWQYEIYVSSTFGVNTTSCWNRGDQTPCVTLSLALQGLQHNSTVIYLYPGTYMLDNTSKVIDKSNIAIIGLTTKDGGKRVTIKCSSHSGLLFLSSTNITLKSLVLDSCGNIQINPNSEFDFQVSAVYISMCYNVQLIDIVVESGNNTGLNEYSYSENGSSFNETMECQYLTVEIANGKNVIFPGESLYLKALVYDCNNRSYDWKNDLIACIISGPASFYQSAFQQCANLSISYLEFSITLYFTNTSINSTDVVLSIITEIPTVQTLQFNISVTLQRCPLQFLGQKFEQCKYFYNDLFFCSKYKNDYNCIISSKDKCFSQDKKLEKFVNGLCPLFYNCGDNCFYKNGSNNFPPSFCAEGRTGRLCGTFASGYGVPINQLNRCVKCKQDILLGLVMFFLIQLLPVTIMVFIIIVFNIQLTNGFMIGVVFYCQIISVVNPSLSLMIASLHNDNYYLMLPSSVFNINFLAFLFNYPLCITPHMTPLQAISFWYIIPTHPLVLLLLIYIWITMYDKGFRCVVTITRPLHHLLARFWRMTNIEPCLIHSIASIYLLCFTQFAATSLQLLHHTTWYVWNNRNDNGVAFFYDGTLDYFGWPHVLGGIFAISVSVHYILTNALHTTLSI